MNFLKKSKISFSWLFMFGILLVYFVLFFIDSNLVLNSLKKSWEMFIGIIPILILVFFIMFGVNHYFKADRISKYLGANSGPLGWFYAIVAGILISGPPYILFPLLGELKEKGMKNSLIAVMLYNRNVKIPFILVMIYYFGLEFTIIISFLIIIFSLPNAWLVDYFSRGK
jgi:uncharacterized membrane protein YraQ (UPF0718 family)